MLSGAEVSLPIYILLRCNSIGYFFCIDGFIRVKRQLHYKAMNSRVSIQSVNVLEDLQQIKTKNLMADKPKYKWCKAKNTILSGLTDTHNIFSFSTQEYKQLTFFYLQKNTC